MTGKRVLWIIAGGNGAGKSTFYHKILTETNGVLGDDMPPLVNADDLARKKLNRHPSSTEEMKSAQVEIALITGVLIGQGKSFCYETVFSHHSKIDLIDEAKRKGYIVNLIYIHLDSDSLNVARVEERVDHGGHPVPKDRIRKRIPRTHENIKKAYPLVDSLSVYDNSSFYELILEKRSAKNTFARDPLPPWAEDLN